MAPAEKRKKGNRPTPLEREANADRAAIAPLKKRSRDLRRLLNAPGATDKLPADVKVAHERELQSLSQEIEQLEESSKKKKLLRRYHMVRFFERKKAERNLRKAKKHLQALSSMQAPPSSSESAEKYQAEREAHLAHIDLNYTQFYPLDVPYLSIYIRVDQHGKAEEQSERSCEVGDDKERFAKGTYTTTINRDQPMWKVVEKCTADGTLQALRDGKLGIGKDGLAKKHEAPEARTYNSGGNRKPAKTEAKDAFEGDRETEANDASEGVPDPVKSAVKTHAKFNRRIRRLEERRRRNRDKASAGDADEKEDGTGATFFEESSATGDDGMEVD